MGTDSQMESKWQLGVGLGVKEMSEKEKGLRDMDNSVVTSEGREGYKGTKW